MRLKLLEFSVRIHKLRRMVSILLAVLAVVLLTPGAASADGDIKISISDPTRKGVHVYEGNTVNTALSVPFVTYGDGRELGTLRITGKTGIEVPVRPGNQVMVELPIGVCYMQAPTAENFKSYVGYPAKIDGLTNQIGDKEGIPGIKFISGTARSITVQVTNVDSTGQTMAIDFIYNKPGLSTVRVSPLLDKADEYKRNSGEEITRLDFFKLLQDVMIRLTPGNFKIAADEKTMGNLFSDTALVSPEDESGIRLLVESDLIAGYPGRLMKPGESLTRAEAVSILVRTIGLSPKATPNRFIDPVPAWAGAEVNTAADGGIVAGYPDGTFRASQPITKVEVLYLLQRAIETHKAE